MGGIESRVREKYGDDYWEKNKREIVKRIHGGSDFRVKFNARSRRKVARRIERLEAVAESPRGFRVRRLQGELRRLRELLTG